MRGAAADVPKQPSTLKRLLHRQFCRQQFFPVDGATSLEAGSYYRRGANAVLTPGMRLLAKLSGARIVLHIQDYEVDAMLGGPCRKRQRRQVAQLATVF